MDKSSFLKDLVVGSQVFVQTYIPHVEPSIVKGLVSKITPAGTIVVSTGKGHGDFKFKAGKTSTSRGQYRGSDYLLENSDENEALYRQYLLKLNCRFRVNNVKNILEKLDVNKLDDNEKLILFKYLTEAELYIKNFIKEN